MIILTGQATLGQAVEAMKVGALDLMEKPADIDELVHRIEDAAHRRALAGADRIQRRINDITRRKGWYVRGLDEPATRGSSIPIDPGGHIGEGPGSLRDAMAVFTSAQLEVAYASPCPAASSSSTGSRCWWAMSAAATS